MKRPLLDEHLRNLEIIAQDDPATAEMIVLVARILATEVVADPRPDTSEAAAIADLLRILRTMRVSAPTRLHRPIDKWIARLADSHTPKSH